MAVLADPPPAPAVFSLPVRRRRRLGVRVAVRASTGRSAPALTVLEDVSASGLTASRGRAADGDDAVGGFASP